MSQVVVGVGGIPGGRPLAHARPRGPRRHRAIYTGLAIPADAIHVLAMACWLGGLVLLFAVVLSRTDPAELRQGIRRYSALALGSIVALVVTGGFQAWRQVGSFNALRDTDYGKLLIAKLVVFAALIVAAAFSREVVNRRFRMPPTDDADDADDAETEPLVAASGSGGGRCRHALRQARACPVVPRSRMATGQRELRWERPRRAMTTTSGRKTTTRRRCDGSNARSSAELVIAFVVLAITALLVNAAPARSIQTQPISMTLKSAQVWVDVVIAPGVAGGNDIHLTALPVGDTVTNVEDMTVQLTRPGADLPPFSVPLTKFGPGHYIASLYDIPYPGDWQMTIRMRLGETDEAVVTGKFTLR